MRVSASIRKRIGETRVFFTRARVSTKKLRDTKMLDIGVHISEDQLEAYAMGKAGPKAAAQIEAHIMDCDECCYRMFREVAYVEVLTDALSELRSSSENPIASRKVLRTAAGCPA